MFDKQTQYKLTELMQNNFTDLDQYRERPFVFRNGKIMLIVKPVSYKEHDWFLQDMATLVMKYNKIFQNIDFLNAYNFTDKDAVNTIIKKVSIFTANKQYSMFKKDAGKFIIRWAFVSKIKKNIIPKHNKRLCKKFINLIEPSEFIYILFLLFVFNFSLVKKNTIEFLKMFQIESIGKTDMSSTSTSKEAAQMPKYSEKPYSKSTLDLFEQQSRLN